MEVYIIRHGETVWNKKGLMQGSMDIELNENGKEAAKKLGEEIKDVEFDRFFCSDLKRARETAELIRGDRDISITADARIREVSFGCMEGSHYQDWLDGDNDLSNFFHKPELYIPPEGAETLEQVIDRTGDFLENVIEPLADSCKRVLIVAHGASNKGMMCRIEGNDIAHFWGRGLQANCQATIFRFEKGKWMNPEA